MKNKGFTIIEIVVVITLLALVMIIIIPSVTTSSDDAKDKIYSTKKKMIEQAAVMYVQDNYNSVISNRSYCRNYSGGQCNITISDLVPNYIVKDNNTESSSDTSCKVENPKGGCLDSSTVNITINTSNKKITAKLNE